MAPTLTSGQGEYLGADNSVLQRAVDAKAETGGVVEVPMGVYYLQDALHLRDKVQLIGEPGTVLRKMPSVSSPLAHLIGFGHYEFAVREPEKFAVGMGVLISDDNAFGFYTTAATIVRREGDLFFIDRPLAHDYNPARGGCVTSVFPLISGVGVRGATVKNLTLDGNSAETIVMNGCRGGGVFLLDSHQITLEQIEVTKYKGDAISFQQCTDIAVSDCYLHHNHGGGLHPGSGSVRYVLRGNRIEENGGCGIFYCLRTTYSLCENNVIRRNGRDGISVGERDTDHLLRGNEITENHGAGIHFREPRIQSGDRVWFEGNSLARNNTEGQSAEIYIADGLHDLCLMGNGIEPLQHGAALHVGAACSHISFVNNQIDGRLQSEADSAGAQSLVHITAPADFPPVGPNAAAPDAALHLGIAQLPSF